MQEQSFFSKYFKSSEEVVSMFLGLVIVLVMVGMVVNYFQKLRGTVELPGLVDNKNKPTGAQVVAEPEGIQLKDVDGTYTVKKNDSLWKIAVATYGDGYAYTKIIKENDLKNPSTLSVGQVLKMPKVEPTITKGIVKTETVTPKSHTVVRGDSLWKIAVATYGDGYAWTKIWKSNKTKLPYPNKLEIGTVLMLE